MSVLEILGLRKTDVFKAVTINSANILDIKKDTRYLRENTIADIAVLKYKDCDFNISDRFDNIVHIEKMYKCVLTICNGKFECSRI